MAIPHTKREIDLPEDPSKPLKRGKTKQKEICHNCLNAFLPKDLSLVVKNNWGIPHNISVCKNCKKQYQ